MFRRVFTYFRTEFNAIRNGKAFVFLICLALSSFLWFLNSLEKRYTDHISVPVKYINLPKNKDLTGKMPEKLELTVDALGFTLLRHKLRLAFSPILIDVNELSNNYLENKFLSKYAISTNGHKEEFAKQISNEIEIISIRPDSISFKVSNVIEKLIKVHPVVELAFAREFVLQRPPVAIPESILVRGPEDILDTIVSVSTSPVVLKNLSQSQIVDADLILPDELTCELGKAAVQISVEQCSEAKFEIPVSIINQPDSLQIKTFPAKVKVSCRIGISQYNKLNNSRFKATVDFSRRSLILSKLPVTLGNIPETVLSVDYFPKEVDYIIERNPHLRKTSK